MKKQKVVKVVRSIFPVLLLIVLVGASKEALPAPPAKPMELSFAHYIPATHWGHEQIFIRWAKEVEKATDGMVKVTVYPAETLLKARETFDGVQRGVANIGVAFAAFNPGRFPLSEAASLPLGISSARSGSYAFWELYKKFPEFQKEYSAVKVLGLNCAGPGKLQTKKPVRSLEDLKGMKLRVSGKWEAKTVVELGASPMLIPTSEIYMAMDKGVMDGAVVSYDSITGFRLHEVVTNITESSLYSVLMYTVMNINTWNSLPPDIQGKIDKVSGVHLVDIAATAFDRNDSLAKEFCVKKGIVIHELSPTERTKWDKIFRSVQDMWVAESEANGLPGRKFIDGLSQFIEKNK
jgi:TRAP-type C4-dicarboxylate transport system substrate-binding protein